MDRVEAIGRKESLRDLSQEHLSVIDSKEASTLDFIEHSLGNELSNNLARLSSISFSHPLQQEVVILFNFDHNSEPSHLPDLFQDLKIMVHMLHVKLEFVFEVLDDPEDETCIGW